MNTKPFPLTRKEIKEIAAIKDIQQMWGATNAAEMEEMLQTTVYAVKFNFHSGSPGYVGDYFILAGDALGEPIQLIRKAGKLAFL
jgi:spore coat polysaccharide biosynthesis protein SpsF (cytidylyltransferase family)